MEKVILSGGNFGGQEIDWTEEQERISIEGEVYRKVNDIAVYEGKEG